LAAGLLALALLVVAWRHHSASARPPAPLRVAPIAPRRAAPTGALGGRGVSTGRTLVLDVVGGAPPPGLVPLRPGARVAAAVAQAGGVGPKAERSAVTLAAPVSDGQLVVVPRRGAAPVGGAAPAAGAAAAPTAPVSLSTASLEELDALPGVGPVT